MEGFARIISANLCADSLQIARVAKNVWEMLAFFHAQATVNVVKIKLVSTERVFSDVEATEIAQEMKLVSAASARILVRMLPSVDQTLNATLKIIKRHAFAHQDLKRTQHQIKDAFAFQHYVLRLTNVPKAICALEVNAICPATTQFPVQSARDASTASAQKFVTLTTTACLVRSVTMAEFAFLVVPLTLIALIRKFVCSRNANVEKVLLELLSDVQTSTSVARNFVMPQPSARIFQGLSNVFARRTRSEILMVRRDVSNQANATRTMIVETIYHATKENVSTRVRARAVETMLFAKSAIMKQNVFARQGTWEIPTIRRSVASASNASMTMTVQATEHAN